MSIFINELLTMFAPKIADYAKTTLKELENDVSPFVDVGRLSQDVTAAWEESKKIKAVDVSSLTPKFKDTELESVDTEAEEKEVPFVLPLTSEAYTAKRARLDQFTRQMAAGTPLTDEQKEEHRGLLEETGLLLFGMDIGPVNYASRAAKKITDALSSGLIKPTKNVLSRLAELTGGKASRVSKAIPTGVKKLSMTEDLIKKGGVKAKSTFAELEKRITDLHVTADDIIRTSREIVESPTSVKVSDEFIAKAHDVYVSAGKKLNNISKILAQSPKDEKALERFQNAIAKDYELAVAVDNLRSTAGRSLAFLKRKPKTIAEELERATMKVLRSLPREEAIKVNQLIREAGGDPTITKQIITDYTKSSWGDKITEFRLSAMLSGIKTHLRNTLGNTANISATIARQPIAASIDLVQSLATGKKREIFFSEFPEMLKSLKRGISKGGKQFAEDLKTIATLGELAPIKSDEIKRIPSIGGKIGSATRTPLKFLTAEDRFFKEIATELSEARWAVREAKGGEILNKAKRIEADVKQMLFQADLPPVFRKLGSTINESFVLKQLFPFYKTPMNLIIEGIRHSPAGVMEGLWKIKSTQGKDILASSILGTALSIPVVAYMMGEDDDGLPNMIGSFPSSVAERDAMYRVGMQPQSIKIGDSYVAFRDFEPFSLYLGVLADASNKFRETGEMDDMPAEVLFSFMKNIKDKSSLASIDRIYGAIIYGKDGGSFAQQFKEVGYDYMASFIPNAIASLTRGLDQTIREPMNLKEVIMTKIPGLSTQVAAKQDVFGKPAKRAGGLFGALINPFTVSNIKITDLERSLRELKITIPTAPSTIYGYKLDEEQRLELNKVRGTYLLTMLNKMIYLPEFKASTDSQKEGMVDSVISLSSKLAKFKYLANHASDIKSQLLSSDENVLKLIVEIRALTEDGAKMTSGQLESDTKKNLDKYKRQLGIDF